MPKIRKAVIPVAGFGTRFLPATKAMPKEMLPVIDKPAVQYAVEMAKASGIKDIILITGLGKRAIEDHFDISPELERWLEKKNKKETLEEIHQINKLANFIYIRQKGPYGNGTPILCARPAIEDEPFAVIWVDDLLLSSGPWLSELIKVFQKYTDPVMSVYEVKKEEVEKYGMIDGEKIEENIFQVKSIVEKPKPDQAPSRLASIGGYILTPDIFDELEKTALGKENELWLVDAVFRLMKKRPLYACQIKGQYFDVGSKIGWLKANLQLGLQHKELKTELLKYLNKLKTNKNET